jgi:chaperonin GroEL (HSP60 family)
MLSRVSSFFIHNIFELSPISVFTVLIFDTDLKGILPATELAVDKVADIRSGDELRKAVRTVIAAKQLGSEDLLAGLVAEAVAAVMPKNPANFNVDSVRVVKIMGSSIEQSRVVKGMVFGREPEGETLTRMGRDVKKSQMARHSNRRREIRLDIIFGEREREPMTPC